MTSAEFYERRDDRTSRVVREQAYSRARVAVTINPKEAGLFAHQVAFVLAVNLTARWARHLRLSDVPTALDFRLRRPGAPGTLTEFALSVAKAADPFGDFDFGSRAHTYGLQIHVGSDPPPGAYPVAGDGWIPDTTVYRRANQYTFPDGVLQPVFAAMLLQLIDDILANQAQHEHIAPAVTRLKAREPDIAKLFDLGGATAFWASNFVVLNLSDVSIEMRKTIPLLVAKAEYARHKQEGTGRTLSILVDEAHNILSTESFREAESWKDYRLETFEEIVKEGRKFGVFVTIASQRPSDISPTISSQAHNYFIHRLINQLDLKAVAGAVSYIDRLAEESIPTLPTGTCIFSGVATGMPIRLNIKPLALNARPRSATRAFRDTVPGRDQR